MKRVDSFKSVCVLGLGRSGAAAARLLRQRDVAVEIFDSGSDSVDLLERVGAMEGLGCRVFTGARGISGTEFDAAIVSPGVSMSSALFRSAQERELTCLSELELAWECLGRDVIAVTGSNGKSTLSQLCVDLFNSCGQRAVACGNFGPPLSEVVTSGESYERIVVEVSSFQLETCDRFRPHIAILLNLNPNHLDRHGTMGAYRALKRRLFRTMQATDFAVIPSDESRDLPGEASQITFSTAAADILISPEYVRERVVGGTEVDTSGTYFEGLDLGASVACAIAVSRVCEIDSSELSKVIHAFEPLPHRMEQLGLVGGVRFVNDSKATNLASMQAAVGALQGPLRLIVGGSLKESDLLAVKELLANKVVAVYLIGESMLAFRDAWNDMLLCRECGTLQSAVHAAWQDAESGDTVVLSPACASFDQFENFEKRGESFRALVQSLRRER